MQNFFGKKENIEQTVEERLNESKVKEYINKYIKELQRHFDMPDKKMRIILYRIYKELSPINCVKNWLYMLKSVCRKK